MAAGKSKLVALLALLILGGALLPLLAQVAANPGNNGKHRIISLPASTEQDQPNNTDRQTNNDQPEDQTGTSSTRELFYKMLISVSVVIILGMAVVYISKKLLPRLTNPSSKQIRVIETTHLAPRKGLHLIQVGKQRLLIASTNDTVTMLADVTCSATSFENQLEASIAENS